MCHMSLVTCHLSPLTCHRSLTATATATDPPPSISPTMHSRLVHKDPKKPKHKKSLKRQKPKSRGVQKLVIHSLTRSLQSTGKWGFQTWTDRQTDRQVTDIATYRLNRHRGQFSEHCCFKSATLAHKGKSKLLLKKLRRITQSLLLLK